MKLVGICTCICLCNSILYLYSPGPGEYVVHHLLHETGRSPSSGILMQDEHNALGAQCLLFNILVPSPPPAPCLRDALNQGWRQILFIARDSLSPFEGELFAHLWSLNATTGVEVFDSHLAQG